MLSDSEVFARLAQLGLHKLAAFQAGDEEAGREFFEISSVVTRAFARRAAAVESGQHGQIEVHSHTDEAERTVRAILRNEAELDARNPVRPSARAEALRILARSAKLA